jgi:hypothetical protein
MRCSHLFAVVATVLVVASYAGAALPEEQPRGEISASVTYDGSVLVVATDAGVAAFSFSNRIHLGTEYMFRFRPAASVKEDTGAGKVF